MKERRPNTSSDGTPGGLRTEGLCFLCRHRRIIRSPRSTFIRCALGTGSDEFPQYPRLPVVDCVGFEEAE